MGVDDRYIAGPEELSASEEPRWKQVRVGLRCRTLLQPLSGQVPQVPDFIPPGTQSMCMTSPIVSFSACLCTTKSLGLPRQR
jgi:hypothetical protein